MIARALLAMAREDLRSRTMAALAEMPDVEVLGVVENSSDLLLATDANADLDLVLLDDQIGTLPLLPLTRELVSRRPDLGILLITHSPSTGFLQAAMDAGARGVVEAPPSVDDLAERIPAIIGWQRQLRAMTSQGLATGGEAAGRLIALTGAKGGVGTTTAALHLALLAVSLSPERRVCLVDFDLQQRGVRQLLDLNGRRTVSDLVSIADSLTGRNIDEAAFVHQSGLRVLLAPVHGEQSDEVTSEVARQVLAAVKGHFDLVVVDCGSVVSEAGAVAMEFADDIALLTSTDIASLRASHDKIEMLSRLQIAKSSDVTLLFNRASSRDEVQPEFGRRITGADSYRTTLPMDWKHLEPVTNSLSPTDLEDGPFRRAIVAWGRELHVGVAPRTRPTEPPADADEPEAPRGGGHRRRRRRERGQVTIEAVIGVAVAVVILLVLLQTVMLALATVSARRAADAAALVGSRGGSEAQALQEARHRTPGMFSVSLQQSGSPDRYQATLTVPTIVPFLTHRIVSTGSATD